MAELGREFAPREPEAEIRARDITADVVGRLFTTGSGFRAWTVVLGLLFLAGLGAFIARLLTAGLGYRPGFGYLAAAFAFLLATAQAAPILSMGLRLAKADWQRPLARGSELFAAPATLSLLLYIPLVITLPPIQGRHTLWTTWPEWVLPLFDTIVVVSMVAFGLAFLYLAAIPDFAAARDHVTGRRRERCAQLARGWRGTTREWTTLRFSLIVLGAFYAMLYACLQLLISYDFALTLVPGWFSSVFPAFQIVTAFEGAVAVDVLALYAWWRWGGLRRYIRPGVFYGTGGLLFCLSLLSLYMWWSAFITAWYGRTPREQNLLLFQEFGSYFVPWVIFFVLVIVLPIAVLVWRPIRHSILGPTLVSLGVVVGVFFDRVRAYVGAFSITDVTAQELQGVPPIQFPDVLDLLMVLGSVAGATLLYLLTAKLVPPLSIWEIKEDLLLRLRRPFLRGEYTVLGKPR